MAESTFRILVVDDYQPWRRFVCSVLQKEPPLQVVGEVSDGEAAVQKAQELTPDLIILDIGLPTLNGIEAARRIRALSPTSKIIFLTQESSADAVQEALSIGANGYVVKMDAGDELLAAVAAVLRGEQFVGSRFAGHDFTGASNSRTIDAFSSNAVHTSSSTTPLRKEEIAHRHEAQFYSDDEFFLDGFTQFIGTALKTGSAVIVLATESHRESLLPRLQIFGIDMVAAIEQGRYISLDVSDTLSTFMINDLPDPVRFLQVAADLIMRAAKAAKGKHPRVAACGECAPVLWQQGNAEAAIRLERLWDQVGKQYDVPILCAYPLGSFQGELGSHIFAKICAEHSIVLSR